MGGDGSGGKTPPLPALRFRPDQDGAAYRAAVAQTVARIAAGEVFQVNITGRMRATRPPGLSAVDVLHAARHIARAIRGLYGG